MGGVIGVRQHDDMARLGRTVAVSRRIELSGQLPYAAEWMTGHSEVCPATGSN
jgi:hypothetical protein